MSLVQVDNRCGITAVPLLVGDEDARPVLAMLLRASYAIRPDGRLQHAEEHAPCVPEGEWNGKPGHSSYRLEPDVVFTKPGTDVVLLGTVPPTPVPSIDVSLQVGALLKTVRVFGRRRWARGGTPRIVAEAPVGATPLLWEHAYGGPGELRNPVGTGHVPSGAPFDDVELPLLEDPHALLSTPQDRPAPAGFGFTCMHWEPRVRWAGTYDLDWQHHRSPRLPLDFDRRYFGGAAPGLCAAPCLLGDEPVRISGLREQGPLQFQLPSALSPIVAVRLRPIGRAALACALDTVVIDADQMALHLTWRAHLVLKRGVHDVAEIACAWPSSASPPA